MKATIQKTLIAAALCTAILAAPANAGLFDRFKSEEKTSTTVEMNKVEPAAGTTYTETTTTSDIYVSRGQRGFSAAEYDAHHSTCKECVDGIYGHGGKPNNWD